MISRKKNTAQEKAFL